nr:hypothetical protein [Actinomycetes bacterium]
PQAYGGKSGGYGEWNIPLGQLGGWDIGTSGNWSGATKMDDGSRQKSGYNVGLNASKGVDFNSLFGGTALADSAKIADESAKNAGKNSSEYWRAQGMTDENAIMDKVLEHMDKGGDVKDKKSIWGTIKSQFANRASTLQGKKPEYKEMGGMTPGPLGMTDLQKIGSDEAVSKAILKKKGKDVEDHIELNYHAPLKYQKPTNTGG